MSAFLEKNSLLVSRKDFVRTYNPRSHTDPVDLIEEYFEVIDYATRHPDKSSGTIATALDLPHRRVQSWIRFDDPVIPRCVRGLETAERNGWIAITTDSKTFQGMNILVASAFADHPKTDPSWEPTFSVQNSSSLQRLITAMQWIGAEFAFDRDNPRSRVSALSVTTAPAVLGRVLHVLGAPRSGVRDEALHLPAYLQSVDREHREAFVKTYLKHRTVASGDTDTLEIEATANGPYLAELVHLIEAVTGESMTHEGRRLEFSKQTAETLGLG